MKRSILIAEWAIALHREAWLPDWLCRWLVMRAVREMEPVAFLADLEMARSFVRSGARIDDLRARRAAQVEDARGDPDAVWDLLMSNPPGGF